MLAFTSSKGIDVGSGTWRETDKDNGLSFNFKNSRGWVVSSTV